MSEWRNFGPVAGVFWIGRLGIALDALLAERQQAIDALREISHARSSRGPGVMGETVEGVAGFARAALLKLGEQPE